MNTYLTAFMPAEVETPEGINNIIERTKILCNVLMLAAHLNDTPLDVHIKANRLYQVMKEKTAGTRYNVEPITNPTGFHLKEGEEIFLTIKELPND
jgi:hypothetical protein